ncbi:hypothetical protein ABKV19_009790 [Rosa sericea]
MMILNLRSLSRKLLRCLDFIRRWLKTIFTVHEDRWSKKLPDDVLQLILQRLLVSDYFSCRDVCRSWRAAIDSKRCLPAYQLPWLLIDSHHSFYIKDDCFVSDRKIYDSKKWRTHYCPGCVGSIEGWLIIEDIGHESVLHQFFLLNPVSGATIMLPSHSAPNYFCGMKAVASSVPTKAMLQRRRCYVSCIHFEKEGALAFCAPADKSWTFVEAKADLELEDIEIIDGKLYAVGRHPLEFLMLFDIQLDSNGGGLHTYTTEKFITLHPNVERIVKCRYFSFWSEVENRYYYQFCYLAKGSESNDLFLILHKRDFLSGKTIGFQVLKLENNVTTGPQWVEIVDLGDQVLFMGGINNKFITSGGISHDQALERNSIYFVFDWSETCESGMFSLTNRSIKPLNFPNKEQLHREVQESLWFTPNPW